jgi:hypothetical protein
MPRSSPMLSSFNAGELSPRLEGRVDIPKYNQGLRICENFIPMIQGPIMRRGGFRYVANVKTNSNKCWLVRFEFNTTQAYILEFGDHYIRFYTNHGQATVTGVAAYSGATTYTNGQIVSNAGINYACKTTTIGNAPPDATYWHPLTGSILEIYSPYSVLDLVDSSGEFNLRFVESADVVYIAQGSYPLYKLSRLGAQYWSMNTVSFVGGPFKTKNTTSTTVYASAATGAVTLTASASIFTANMVGTLFYLEQKSVLGVKAWEAGKAVLLNDLRRASGRNYKALNAGTTGGDRPTHTEGAVYDGDTGVQWQYQDSGFGNILITGYTSGTQVTGTVVPVSTGSTQASLPDGCVLVGNASAKWAYSLFNATDGYATQCAFFRQRLALGRGQDVVLSVSGDYEHFSALDLSGLQTADMAVSVRLQTAQVNSLQWMAPSSAQNEGLLCGTAGAEMVIKSQTEQQPFGPDNVTAVPISNLGSKNAAPAHVNNVVLFVQRAGVKLRDIVFDVYQSQYQSVDQSVLAEHIMRPGASQLVYQQEPYSILWMVRSDGQLIGMTYNREQYPEAPHGGWHRHKVGGDGVVESIASIPSPDGTRDELWALVKRTINGSVSRTVEWMDSEHITNDDPHDDFYVDCGATLDGAISAGLVATSGAATVGSTGVNFTCDSPVFVPGDVGRYIYYRYSQQSLDESGNAYTEYINAKALITGYVSAIVVTCTITAAFPTFVYPLGSWGMTSTTISGLTWLEGETVTILADGATHPDRTVTGGAITLQSPAYKAQIGLGYEARAQTMRLNYGSADGTTQGKYSRINFAVVRLIDTVGLEYGNTFTALDEIEFRTAADALDNSIPLFTGDKRIEWTADWDSSPWMCFSHNYPLPCFIVALMPQITTNDRG